MKSKQINKSPNINMKNILKFHMIKENKRKMNKNIKKEGGREGAKKGKEGRRKKYADVEPCWMAG